MKIPAPNSFKAGITVVALLLLQSSLFFDITAKSQQIACRTTQAFQFLDKRNRVLKNQNS
jgi:hypothetical protein